MEKLEIVLKNGRRAEYQQEDYSNWYYDGNAVIIKKDNSLVAVYSIVNIVSANIVIEK